MWDGACDIGIPQILDDVNYDSLLGCGMFYGILRLCPGNAPESTGHCERGVGVLCFLELDEKMDIIPSP